jgi:protein-S-isoprenylcysteine O-methyltransferase Ste14
LFFIPLWLKIAAFLFMTVPISLISWHGFKQRPRLGISRFISYELVILVVILNLDHLFHRPLSWLGLASWLLLAASLLLVLSGIFIIVRRGEAEFGLEDTTKLITKGAFKYLQHPLYASLLFLGWGFFLKNPTWQALASMAVATVFLVVLAQEEEQELLKKFGDEYRQYMKGVKRFIPFVY